MKKRKSLCSLFLLTLLLGTVTPVAVSATTDTSTSTTVEEPNTTTEVTTMSDPLTSEVTEPAPSEITGPSTSEVTEPTDLEPVTSEETSENTTVEESTTEVTTSSETTEEIDPNSPTAALEKAGILEAIIGKDDQYRVNNTKTSPYRTVVHLEMRFGNTYYTGTGVLIAPNLVLTVAHNIYDQEKKVWANSVVATPGKNGSQKPYGSFSSSTYYTFRRYKTETPTVPSDYDTAVIKLNKNVPSGVGYLPVSTSVRKNERIQIPGYPAYSRSKDGKMYTAYGTVDDLNTNLIGHLVDTEGGNSGSPILNSKNQVIGVHSAGVYTTPPYGTYNVGRRINSATLRLIDIAKNNKALTVEVTSNREKNTGIVYRLYHPGIKRHLYTRNLDEANVLGTRGWNFEGAKFKTATSGSKPVYRLYGKVMKEHLYTTSKNERDVLARTGTWNAEGIAWYSAGTKKVYRLYHSGLRVHLYTADTNEVKVLGTRGWKNEGVAFYTQ